MNILITLDYELFFGPKSGTVEKCIIEPTEALLEVLDPYSIKIIFFVDAGYLIALNRQKAEFENLREDYEKVAGQIKHLSDNGHGIELHVHPHWEDSYYDGKQWIFDTTRYKLSDFSEKDVMRIVTDYTQILKKISGKSPVAYRAGGWSAQPFQPIAKALRANDIFIDSTVYPKGYYRSRNQMFDFRNVSQYTTSYRFSDDLTVASDKGDFLEIPISSMKVGPIFFWKFAFQKLRKNEKHISFGDGAAIPISKKEAFRLMTTSSYSVVSIDGYKTSLIDRAYRKYKRHAGNESNFVLIGHPKAFSPYSLKKLENFVERTASEDKYLTYSNL